MSATLQRDQVNSLAKTNPKKAHEKARKINDPWFRAQALSAIARHTKGDPITFAKEAAKAAKVCEDDYKRSAVRAWEIAALAERNCSSKARKALSEAVNLAKTVQPISSRSESLFHLLQAAFAIDRDQAIAVSDILREACPIDEHWRCKRNLRYTEKMISGEVDPRKYF